MTEKGSGQRKVNYTKWQVGKKNGKLSVTLWVVISSSFFPFLSALCILYFVRRQKGVESSLSGKSEQNEWTTVFSLGPSEAAHTAAKLWNGSILLRCQQVRFIHLLIYLSICFWLLDCSLSLFGHFSRTGPCPHALACGYGSLLLILDTEWFLEM